MLNLLYKKHNYLNKNIPYLISNEIIEYDIKSAGFNILKKYGLIDNQRIQHLEILGKKQRQIQIGMYMRENKELGKILNEKLEEVRKWFFESNGLVEDDILSIKKDAIITTKRCLNTEFDNIQFIEKNFYTSYYYLNNYEFYFNRDRIDVKGISDELLKLHREYMLDFLHNFFQMNELRDRKKVIEMLKQFAHYYKARELHIGYYRELNTQSLYRIHERLFGQQVGVTNIGDINAVDIGYNYMNYVVPLISILV